MRLAFAVFGGIAAWSAHLLLSSWLVAALCPATTPLLVALYGTTLAGIAVAAAGALVAARVARRTIEWRRFLARFGLLLDLLALAAVVLAGLAPLFVPPCV